MARLARCGAPRSLCLAACFIAAGCGGSSSAQEEPDAPTLESLWRAPGEDVAIVPGAADFGPGQGAAARFSSSTARARSSRVRRPGSGSHDGLKQPPFAESTAVSEQIGVEGGDPAEVEAVFVAELDLEKPGKYWLLAEPVGGAKIQAVGNVVVKEKPAAPAIGDACAGLRHADARERDDRAADHLEDPGS